MGYCCGLLSTIANYVCGERFETTNTTQDPITVNRLLRMMVDRGCEYGFMEVSSHALHQGRVRGLHFRGAVFTNITHDHLDYHKTFSEYIRCKKLLFDSLEKGSFALINSDDRNASIMVQNTTARVYRYSEGSMAEFKVRISGAQSGRVPAEHQRNGSLDTVYRGLQRAQYLRSVRYRPAAWRRQGGDS